ncbi:MAG: hypothetical protein ACOC71_03265 [Hyphomicrobiales bacterium]
MTVLKLSALAAGVIGGAMAMSGTAPASAATLAPALAQVGENASVQQVDHNRRTRPGWKGLRSSRRYGPSDYGYRYRRSGPTVGLGLSVPGFSFGIGVPTRQYSYGYGQPYSYGYTGYPGYGYYGY